MCSAPDPPKVPPPPPPRAAYVMPAPKSTLSTQGADDRARRASMGIVNPGGAQGLLEPASTTANLVLGGGTSGLNLSGGSGTGGAAGSPAAPAPSGPISSGPAQIIPPSGGRPSGGGGFRFKWGAARL